MGIEVSKFHLPVNFELDGSVHDSRLKKVKVWIAHTGENLNNTYFTKEVLEDMAKTLPYTPITGFIEKNEDEENDFSDHRMSLVIEKNKVKLEYQGHAYGFVSDEPNSKFEFRNGKEWLTCDGYLWTKFRQALEVFENENGVKSQSMEIQDVDGEVDEFGRMVFSTGAFSALCILGDHVPPAMTGSTAEFYSATKESIREMIYEFSLLKGESNLIEEEIKKIKKRKPYDDEEETEPLTPLEPSTKTEPLTPLEPSIKTEPLTPLEPSIKTEPLTPLEPSKPTTPLTPIEPSEPAEPEPEPDVDPEPEVDPEVDPEVETETEESSVDDATDTEEEEDGEETEDFSQDSFVQFQVSYEELRSTLNQLGSSLFEDEYTSAYISETYDDRVIYEVFNWREDSRKFFQVNYEKVDGTISLGEASEVFSILVTQSEKDRIAEDRERLVELESEIASLQDYKSKLEHKEKEDILDKFQERLTEEESAAIREQFSKLSVLEVEKEIAYTCFTKSSDAEEFTGVRSVGLGATETNGAYGSLNTYFKKQ